MKGIQKGDTIPAFSLPDQQGRVVTHEALLSSGPLVIFFYPKDDTPGCTVEACRFRDVHESFVELGAKVVGVSADSSERHLGFAGRHQLPYTLLSDTHNEMRRAFGVPCSLGILPGRTTYVFDREGIVQHVFNAQLKPLRHVSEALACVRRLVSDERSWHLACPGQLSL